MVFNDTATKLGLIQDVEQNVFGNYGDVSSNTNRLYDITARINRAYDKVASLIMGADGKWHWDDTNHTDLPIGSTNLVDGQRDYTMDVEFLDVLKVVVLDSAGNKTEIKPYGINDPVGGLEMEDLPVTEGIPHSYRKTGTTFMLYPVPNYSVASGLIVYFQRKPSYFAHTDTTKAVGIPAIFHRYLSLEASLDYAISKQLTVKNDLAVRVKEMEDSITEWYAKRAKDEQKFIRSVIKSSR
jgi:hypothetical protein